MGREPSCMRIAKSCLDRAESRVKHVETVLVRARRITENCEFQPRRAERRPHLAQLEKKSAHGAPRHRASTHLVGNLDAGLRLMPQ